LISQEALFLVQNVPKLVYGRALLGPAGGAYSAPPDRLARFEGGKGKWGRERGEGRREREERWGREGWKGREIYWTP